MESGRQAMQANHPAEAEKHFKQAIKEARKSGQPDLRLAESLDGLAADYRDQKKYSRSEALYRQSLYIKETTLGPWHLTVATALDDLGGLLASEGKHNQADQLYKRAREIREHAIATHPDIYVEGVSKPIVRPNNR